MIIDKLKRPQTMWIEDEQGNIVSDETEIMKNEPPPCFDAMCDGNSKRYANFRSLIVKHDVFGDKSEKNPSGLVMSMETTVHAFGKSIALMTMNHGWTLDDAAILLSILCEGCMNTVMSELEGWTYNENPSTCCEYCDQVRPGVNRPLTAKEEQGAISSILAQAGFKEYASILHSMDAPITKRIVLKDSVTGIYHVIESTITEDQFKGKEIDNSKGKFGFGNRIYEFKSKSGKFIRIVSSKYSKTMRTGSALNGVVTIFYYDSIQKYKSAQPTLLKEFKGDNKESKADRFLKTNFGLSYPFTGE